MSTRRRSPKSLKNVVQDMLQQHATYAMGFQGKSKDKALKQLRGSFQAVEPIQKATTQAVRRASKKINQTKKARQDLPRRIRLKGFHNYICRKVAQYLQNPTVLTYEYDIDLIASGLREECCAPFDLFDLPYLLTKRNFVYLKSADNAADRDCFHAIERCAVRLPNGNNYFAVYDDDFENGKVRILAVFPVEQYNERKHGHVTEERMQRLYPNNA